MNRVSNKLEISPRSFGLDWVGQTALVLGNGPSTLGYEPEHFDRPSSRLLVCNGGYLRFPHAHLLVATDRKWLLTETTKDEPFAGYRGGEILITRPEAAQAYDPRMIYVKRLDLARFRGVDQFADPGLVVEGWTSVTTMIAAAVMRGARRIILLGVDLQPGKGNRRRSYDESVDTPSAAEKRYAKQIADLEAQMPHVKRRGVEVLNASPGSGLKCYPYVSWEDVTW